MSRSFLHSKWMRKIYEKICKDKNKHSIHQQDEVPKNYPSKDIQLKCPGAEWLQEPVNFGSHKPKKDGHRMVSGIVRAKTKKEIREQIDEQLNENIELLEEKNIKE